MKSLLKKLFTFGIVVLIILILPACGNTSSVQTPSDKNNSLSDSVAITATESWDHIGEQATVEYYVDNPYQSSKGNIFLNEKSNYKSGFTAVIFDNVKHKFSGNPINIYGNKNVRVIGTIKLYDGHPEIIVNSPSQIVVID